MAYTNESSYYNLFDPAKKYFEVRALAGYVEQSREDNEIQSILKNIVKRLGDSVWRQGELVSGGGYVRDSGSNINALMFNASKVYVDGIVHDVDSKTVTLTGSGSEEVGVRVIETLITPSADAELRDPAVGFANYGQPGANRLKVEAVWDLKSNVLTGDKFYPAYKFDSGVEVVQPKVGEIDVVTQQLARRTYDESGNYVVAGFDISTEPKNDQEVYIKVGNRDLIGNSKAYVQGYEILKIADERKAISKALGTSSVSDERKDFTLESLAETSNPPTARLVGAHLLLDVQPAARVTKVTAEFEAVQEVSGHALDQADTVIRNTGESSIQIKKVFSGPTSDPGASGVGYVTYVNAGSQSGTGDYYYSGGKINWNVQTPVNSEPTASSYYIYYTFRKEIKIGEECELDSQGRLDLSKLTAKNTSSNGWILDAGRKVAVFPFGWNRATSTSVTSDIDIDYEYYLPRYDVVYLDVTGEVKIQTGEYADKPSIPFVSASKLSLGHLFVPAGGDYDEVVVTQYNVRRLTMAELRKLYDRLERAEFNQAVIDLNAEATKRVGNSITSLSGILTEAFAYTDDEIANPVVNGVTRIKFNRNKTSNKIFNVAYREMSLPQIERDITNLDTLDSGELRGLQAGISGAVTLSPSIRSSARISSLEATETINVNQFDSVLSTPVITTNTNQIQSERSEIKISSLIPNSAAVMLAQTLPQSQTARTNTAAAVNLTGTVTDYALTRPVAQTWVWCSGKGFKGNEKLNILVAGLPVRLTVNTGVTGGYRAPAGLSAASRPTAPLSGFIGFDGNNLEVGSSTIYEAGSQILTNSRGEFEVAFETPAGFIPGKAKVQIESADGANKASTVITGKADLTLKVADAYFEQAAAVTSAVVSNPGPMPIKAATVPVEFYTGASGAGVDQLLDSVTGLTKLTSNNFTGTVHLYAKINWDAGGSPLIVSLTHTLLRSDNPARTRVLSLSNHVNRDSFWTKKFVVVYLGQVSEAFAYNAELLNGGPSSSYRSIVTKAGVPTSNSLATSSSGIKVTNPGTSRVNGVVNISYSSVPSSYNTVTYFYTNASRSGSGTLSAGQGKASFSVASTGTQKVILVFSNSTTKAAEISTVEFASQSNDPLAQTFTVPDAETNSKGMFVKGAKVYFSEIPDESTNAAIYAYITPVINGYPAPSEFAIAVSSSLHPDQCQVSTNTTLVPTDFVFQDLVYLEKNKSYALVLVTSNSDYKVWVGKVGGTLFGTNGSIKRSQSIGDGSLFEGATTEIWAPKPEYDLVFELVEVESFTGMEGASDRGTFTFEVTSSGVDDVETNNMIGFHLDAVPFIPTASPGKQENDYKVVWEYRLGSSSVWTKFEPQDYIFTGVQFTDLGIRATLISNDGLLSPVIFPKYMVVTGVFRETAATYESNVATYSQPYSTVRMIGKMAIPDGSNVNWFVSDNILVSPSALPTWAALSSYSEGDIVAFSESFFRANTDITGNALNEDPATDLVRWKETEVEESGRVWIELTPVGTTAADSLGFKEYEQMLELPSNISRTQFMFKVTCSALANYLHTPPRIRDIITIVNT